MGNIVLLDELTINKIAAGEVVERPASVIKEMVENSIDAGATSISIEIKNGGISYIRIIDNGKGIMPDDMEIAFERHATSKIRSADDLETIHSMGFRGEALASVSAISKVEMVSRTRDLEIGNKIVVEAGNVLEMEETGAPVGTSITVTNLFFNTPVRYKFLKKDFTETGYIEDSITRLALINTNIAFKLINTGKTVIQTSGNGDIKEVIYNIYGKDVTDGSLIADYTYEDVHITGIVGKPEIARSNRSNQLFFVNNRFVKDKTLSGASEKAFKGMLPIGKYGFIILNLEMNPAKVDVNVHPAKLEVRFEEESKVFKAVYHAIRETLLKNDLIADTEKKAPEVNSSFKYMENPIESTNKINSTLFSRNDNPFENKARIDNANSIKAAESTNSTFSQLLELQKKMQADVEISKRDMQIGNSEKLENVKEIDQKELNKVEEKTDVEINSENEIKPETIYAVQNEEDNDIKQKEYETKRIDIAEMVARFDGINENNPKDFDEMYIQTFGKLPAKEEKMEKEDISNASELIHCDNISVFEDTEDYKYKKTYKFIGIAFRTYIIIEMDDDLYLIDQHAAHERIMYEKVKQNFYNNEQKDSQLMILPDVITLTHKEMGIAKDSIELFEKAGFIIEEFGENTIKISGTPSICLELDNKELFLETLDEINTVARTAKQEIEEKFIATIACKAAVKAHMILTSEEVESLMDVLLKLPNPFTCPHGRPTAIKMTKNDIEKKFSRR